MALNVFDRLIQAIPEQELVESDIAFRIAQRIDFLMRKNNLSKSELARSLGKDPAQISRWMSGVHNFSLKTLAELEVFFKEQILISPTESLETTEYTAYLAQQIKENATKTGNYQYAMGA